MPRLSAGTRRPVRFTLNGAPVAGEAEPRMLLTDFLRHSLGTTGTHVGCEHGICGACTILIDGAPARACLTLAVQASGTEIRTVEGLATQAPPHPAIVATAPASFHLSLLQECFREHHAVQCGFCTPGILMSLTALLAENPAATETEIRETLAGHLCRCTGYAPIVRAALAAAARLREARPHA
jgi:2-furoyl-CoA dehydrogenase 2Fe-2S iron sulfur subunit